MKLVNMAAQFEIEGAFEKLADTLAIWRAETPELYERLFSQMAQGEWLAEVTPEACVDIVEGAGLKLLSDDGTPASYDTVVRLGRRAWERLQEIIEMEVAEEL